VVSEASGSAVGTRPPAQAAIATAVVFTMSGFVIAAWLSRLPATRDRLDADPRTIGLTLLMMGLGSLSSMPFVGRLAARHGSKRVVLVTCSVSSLSLIAVAVTPTVVTTGLLLYVLGASYGAWDVAMNIQGSHVDRTAGRDYMPRYHACWSVGAILGAGVGALAAAAGVSLLVHFTISSIAAAALTCWVAATFFVDDRHAPDEDAGATHTSRARLLTRRIVLIGVITLCGTLLEGAANDWITLYLTDDRHQAPGVAAFGYVVFAVAMASSRFAGTPVIARLGRARAIRVAGVTAGLGVAVTLAMPGVPGSMLGILLWGIGTALVFPAAMSAGGEQPGRAADAIATVSTIGYGGFLVGPPLIGLVAQQVGLGHALWILPALGVGVALLAPVVAPPRP
jgi:predicted MFS family arabinose efflux permease